MGDLVNQLIKDGGHVLILITIVVLWKLWKKQEADDQAERDDWRNHVKQEVWAVLESKERRAQLREDLHEALRLWMSNGGGAAIRGVVSEEIEKRLAELYGPGYRRKKTR